MLLVVIVLLAAVFFPGSERNCFAGAAASNVLACLPACLAAQRHKDDCHGVRESVLIGCVGDGCIEKRAKSRHRGKLWSGMKS